MHKHIGLVLLAVIVGTLFLVPQASDKLFALFFIGLVPFTNYTLAPSVMFIAYTVLLGLGFYAVIRQLETVTSPAKREIQSRKRARKKVLHDVAKTHPAAQKAHPKKHYLPATDN